jgi:hypothetical protein
MRINFKILVLIFALAPFLCYGEDRIKNIFQFTRYAKQYCIENGDCPFMVSNARCFYNGLKINPTEEQIQCYVKTTMVVVKSDGNCVVYSELEANAVNSEIKNVNINPYIVKFMRKKALFFLKFNTVDMGYEVDYEKGIIIDYLGRVYDKESLEVNCKSFVSE